MTELRIHGRGGQGAVVAAHLLAMGLFSENKWVQAFPNFGVERRGAPVAAFVRFDDKPIEVRCHIYTPDYVIILDPTLVELPSTTEGLKPETSLLVNTPEPPEALESLSGYRTATVNAGAIAHKYGLGSASSPIVNTAILGAFSRFSGVIALESVKEAVRSIITRKTEVNIKAVLESSESLVLAQGGGTGAGVDR